VRGTRISASSQLGHDRDRRPPPHRRSALRLPLDLVHGFDQLPRSDLADVSDCCVKALVTELPLDHVKWRARPRQQRCVGMAKAVCVNPLINSRAFPRPREELTHLSGVSVKPTRGLEPRTPSLRERRGVCGWLRSVALTDQDKPISGVSPPYVCGWCRAVCCHPVATCDRQTT
jgi:hypothetical protein